MNKWTKEYDNDTGPNDDCFVEWWNVTDGTRTFKCETEEEADFLITVLSSQQPPQQPVQEPVAWMFEDDEDNGHKTFRQTPPSPEAAAYLAKWNRPAWVPLYTDPLQRKPLTDEEIDTLHIAMVNDKRNFDGPRDALIALARAIEAAHNIKGEA